MFVSMMRILKSIIYIPYFLFYSYFPIDEVKVDEETGER